MRAFFSPAQLAHAPVRELHNGGWTPYAETPARAEAILAAIEPAEPAVDHGEAPILAVHDADYVAFLKTAHDRWRAAGREGDAIGYAYPVVRRRKVRLERVDAPLGRHGFDGSTPIAAGTWEAAHASAQTALTALDAVLGGERSAFALCRPPGHHSGTDYGGGYCHLNAAAIATQAARDAGRARVAILDIDYHHGNGTQDVFYGRGDVVFASIHADPATDYPFFWGHADEAGEGDGEGATLNLPLPRGTAWDGYARALDTALDAIARFGPDLLVVSYGADTWAGDPISAFRLATADYTRMGARIAGCGWPTLAVMEGGYALDALGANVASFLEGIG